MVRIGSLVIDPPVLNSSCPWASTRAELEALFSCPDTGATVTRTATLDGFPEDEAVHRHVFFSPGGGEPSSSLNTYGYSPRPLAEYISDVESILLATPSSKKPFIISVSGDLTSLPLLLSPILDLRRRLGPSDKDRVGVEFNASCPNIPDKPPPAYDCATMLGYLRVLARAVEEDDGLTVGVKLPPYTHHDQFVAVVDALEEVARRRGGGEGRCPVAYVAATNTLGSSLVVDEKGGLMVGGLAGDSIHSLSLGNVYKLSSMMAERPLLHDVKVVGIGGVRSAEGARSMLRAGATAVACATALGRFGPAVFADIRKGIEDSGCKLVNGHAR